MWDPVPQPGIKPGLPALGVQSLSHWTTREVPIGCFDEDEEGTILKRLERHSQ